MISIQADEALRCYSLGIGDVDDAPGVQVDCRAMSGPDGSSASIEPCVLVDGAFEFPAPTVDICYAPLTDAAHEGDPVDDVSQACIDARGDLLAVEIRVLRRSGSPAAAHEVLVSCAAPEPLCGGAATE